MTCVDPAPNYRLQSSLHANVWVVCSEIRVTRDLYLDEIPGLWKHLDFVTGGWGEGVVRPLKTGLLQISYCSAGTGHLGKGGARGGRDFCGIEEL